MLLAGSLAIPRPHSACSVLLIRPLMRLLIIDTVSFAITTRLPFRLTSISVFLISTTVAIDLLIEYQSKFIKTYTSSFRANVAQTFAEALLANLLLVLSLFALVLLLLALAFPIRGR